MAEVRLKNIIKRFGNVEVIKSLNLHIYDGEFLVLVGGSGCGKSTTLRMIAGLETIDEGDLYIGDKQVNDVPPKNRDIAMVFQNYALYPHMTVYDNIAFGLKLRKYSKAEIQKRVENAAEMLDISPYLHRKPKELSGGQRQRVALGRAIVRDAHVFLMDEPLSNLDAKLRTQTRTEIKRLQKQLNVTTVYVTHDQIEAMTMGDRIAVMKDGVIQQLAPPTETYEFPANKFVAGFIGNPSMNFLKVNLVDIDDSQILIESDGLRLKLPKANENKDIDKFKGKEVLLGIRPEFIFLSDSDADSPGAQAIQGWVDVIEPSGSRTYIHLSIGDTHKVVAEVDTAKTSGLKAGTDITLWIDTLRLHIFEPVTEINLMSTAKANTNG